MFPQYSSHTPAASAPTHVAQPPSAVQTAALTPRPRRAPRTAFTVLELLIAISIMVMIIGAMGALTSAVRSGSDYCADRARATEHARVILDRIVRTVDEATANEHFPGFIVLSDTIGAYNYPDTLVVWHPDPQVLAANPSRLSLDDPNRLPYYDELVVICPNPGASHQLVEIRSRSTACLSSNAADWPTDIASFKSHMVLDTDVLSGTNLAEVTYPAVTLTDLLRTCTVSQSGSATRGAVRFQARLRPSDTEWNTTTVAWEALPWTQGIYGPTTGLRQAWLRTDLQLVSSAAIGNTADATQIIPFFGSAAVYYTMHKEQRP